MKLAALLIASLFVALVQSQCSPINIGNGQTVNLASIPTTILQVNQIYQGSSTPYSWAIDLCGTNPPTPSNVNKICAPRGYVEEYSSGTINCEQAFTTVGSAWQWNGSAMNAKFLTSSGWNINVGIVCGNTLTLQSLWPIYASGSGTISWGMQLSSSAVCPSSPNPPGPNPQPPGPQVTIEVEHNGMGGTAFVVVVFVGGFLYVVGTVLYNKFKLGKTGKELAPHPEFWLSLPGLIKDGFIFTFTKIRGICKRDSNAGGYSAV
jgi:hypothetical protein